MPLDQKFRRFALLMESEIARMLERQEAQTRGAEEVRPDQAHGTVTYLRQGAAIWQARVEKIAEHSADLGVFKWWFHGFSPELDRVRLGLAFREGERWQMHELTKEQLFVDADEAELVCQVAAQLARADGILRVPGEGHATWYALYDARDGGSTRPPSELRDTQVNRGSERPAWMVGGLELDSGPSPRAGFRPAVVGMTHSVPPPAASRTGPIPPSRPTMGVRSLAPSPGLEVSPDDFGSTIPAPAPAPRTVQSTLPVREIRRELFLPVAQSALAEVVQQIDGFRQALLVVRIDLEQSKGRFVVQLVGIDAAGDLHALDASRPLVDAVAKLIGDDSRDGNGRWKKLVVRMRHTERGAAVEQTIA